MPNIHFNDRVIAGLKEEGTYWDLGTKAFGVRIGKSAKTFIVIRDGGRRIKLGRYPDLSLQDARAKARRILLDPLCCAC